MSRRIRSPVRVAERVFGFLALGMGLTLLSGVFAPGVGYVLVLLACVFIGHGLGLPDTTGLRHHRQ